jgi:hypothetical protein
MDFILVYRLIECMRKGSPPTWTSTTRPPGAPPAR